RPLEARHHHQQRRLAGARRTDQADRLAAPDLERDVLENVHTRRAGAERQVDPRKRDGRWRGCGLDRDVVHAAVGSWAEGKAGEITARRGFGTFRSYGNSPMRVQMALRVLTVAAAFLVAAILAAAMTPSIAADRPLSIVALGDSLTAGLGLAASDAFPAKLQRALAAKGIAATVVNAGVSGDTTSGGLARLDWSV